MNEWVSKLQSWYVSGWVSEWVSEWVVTCHLLGRHIHNNSTRRVYEWSNEWEWTENSYSVRLWVSESEWVSKWVRSGIPVRRVTEFYSQLRQVRVIDIYAADHIQPLTLPALPPEATYTWCSYKRPNLHIHHTIITEMGPLSVFKFWDIVEWLWVSACVSVEVLKKNAPIFHDLFTGISNKSDRILLNLRLNLF